MIARQFSAKVVGVTFRPGYPENITYMDAQWRGSIAGQCDPLVVSLRRDQTNPDPNAVAVDIDGDHVGYIAKGLAARLAPELDAGVVVFAEVECVWPAHDDYSAGVTIHCTRVDAPVSA